MRAKHPSGAGESESPITRWSRRKREAFRNLEEGEPTRGRDTSREEGQAAHEPAKSGTPPPGDADMPPVESLGPESDYSGFMSPGVSEELRRLALRKLFHSPLYNITDGLDDYDDDFTSFAVLHEAFHARHGKASAPESAAPEGADYETASDSGSARPEVSASAEGGQKEEEATVARPDEDSAEAAGERARREPEARAAAPRSELDDAAPTRVAEPGAAPGEGPESGHAGASDGAIESTPGRRSSDPLSDELQETESRSDLAAAPGIDEKAPAGRPEEREIAEDRGRSGRDSDEMNRHG